ncbi:DUF2812 domain-containing protein [Priestia taiwanensis]|uniref:DUF2812 domain-containing protein n=1 Tax=Priestia taiwanensis TaxID=1347902 RepID=A0A917ASF6_9BACI|nr:DUF2812 domain-containing protein [Priestia taiwanensis]MBM7364144.1 hypothetical protein [Priestia taiwanensis]GGE71954.1 hypothetical protein GCM10007140_22380 [Priestia taiwanensis]
MPNKRSLRRINKKFNSFTQEEQWLQSMLDEGWVLKGYSADDIDSCQYVFAPIQQQKQRNYTYKVDYRIFSKKDEFEEYRNLFEDTGWTLLSEGIMYTKHIFYTDIQNNTRHIFSDLESYKEREKRRMSNARIDILISIISALIPFILYIIYEREFFIGGIIGILAAMGIPACITYYKHRKAYKLLLTQENTH